MTRPLAILLLTLLLAAPARAQMPATAPRYDPAASKYGHTVENLVRAAGALTVAALATGLFLLIRRDRQRTRQSASTNHEVSP